MFDRHFYVRTPDVQVHHTEKRAPTDESVRLLREMEDAARKQVVESMRLDSNAMTAVIHRHRSDFDLRTYFSIHYSLNGTKREVKTILDDGVSIYGALDHLRKELADDIACVILEKHITEIAK